MRNVRHLYFVNINVSSQGQTSEKNKSMAKQDPLTFVSLKVDLYSVAVEENLY